MSQTSQLQTKIEGRRAPLNRVKLICDDPSLTKQSFSKDSDIRQILAKYAKTGILGDPNRTPIFGDFTRTDYETSLNNVSAIKSQFENCDVRIRERFRNNVGELLEFLSDEKNKDEAIALGLRPAPPPPADVLKEGPLAGLPTPTA